MTFTTYGPIRGCCGHRHKTRDAAERCRQQDQNGCASQSTGGYTDRDVAVIGDDGFLYYDEECTDWVPSRGQKSLGAAKFGS